MKSTQMPKIKWMIFVIATEVFAFLNGNFSASIPLILSKNVRILGKDLILLHLFLNKLSYKQNENIEHNAKKNEKFIELFTKCEELKAVTQNNHREIQEIRRSQKEI